MNVNGTNIAVNFFDTSGEKDFGDIRKEFYKDTQGVVLMFDLTSVSSFEDMKDLEKEMKGCVDSLRVKIHVVGCKSDLEVNRELKANAEKWSKSNGYEFFEVSNVDGNGVNACFFSLFIKVITQVQREKDRYQL
mmetsp:Transcript_63189/g.136810  ORF Transcript_63189/g.136810 Transcript_63189/m.136810 type:complete len:134 (+) Transcript_63189:837-1238(+)